MPFIRRINLQGLLSFPPDMEPFELQPLNVLIGPNGSGKTNFIEALELLHATSTDFAAAIREGGGAAEWVVERRESDQDGGGRNRDRRLDTDRTAVALSPRIYGG